MEQILLFDIVAAEVASKSIIYQYIVYIFSIQQIAKEFNQFINPALNIRLFKQEYCIFNYFIIKFTKVFIILSFYHYYFHNIQMQEVSLTSSQKNQIQNQKQLYVLLRMIHFIQKYYSYDRIDKTTYQNQITKLIQKYKRFTQIIQNYSLEEYCKKYAIPQEDISWAKLVLQKGVHTEESQSKQTFLYMQAVAKFIEVIQTLDVKSDNPLIGQLRTPLQQLQIILNRLYSKLGKQFSQKFGKYKQLLKIYVQNRSINQSLTESQFKQIKLNVEGMYRMMEIIMKS